MSEFDPLIAGKRKKYYYFVLITLPILIFSLVFIPLLVPTKIPIPRLHKHLELNPSEGRLVLIGDVHGCYDQLIDLLGKIHHNKSDNVVLLGDFISKGPDSLKVLDFMMKNDNLHGVLGNHEVSTLWKYSGFRPLEFIDGERVHFDNDEPPSTRFDEELKLSLKLSPEHIEYLASLPLILDLRPWDMYQKTPAVAVHIGLVNPYDLNNQSYNGMLELDKKQWFRDFNKAMKKKKHNRYEVFYGHAASVGLNIGKYYNGLDTSCVTGGQLTAMVIDQKGDREIVSVNC